MTCEAETLQRQSLWAIAAEVAALGCLTPSGQPYQAIDIRQVLAAEPGFPSNCHTRRRARQRML